MKNNRLFEIVSEILSICIFLCGAVALIGWFFDIPVLKSISPDFVAIKANTAICFILIGLSLWLSQAKRADNRLCRRIARTCAFVVFLTGFLTFWQYLLGWDFGIDQLLFEEPASAILTSSPGRMAFNTSIIFVIISIALFLTGFETVLFSYLAHLLVIPAGIITLLSFVGYLYGATPLYIGLKFSTAMAIHTCVLFLMSCIACLFARPRQGLMKNISSDNYGGLVFRRILPVVIFVPLVLGGLKIYGERTKWFSNEFGVSLVATSNLVVVSLFVYILSVYLNRLDAKRKHAEQRQTETLEQLEKTNSQLSEFAHLATHDLKTPLRGISVLAEWLVKDYHDKFDERGQKQIGLLVKRVGRMDNLINAVLQYSTIVRNRKNEHPADLNILFRAVLAEIKPPSNIKITANKDLPIVICEEGHIYQVFCQLLANAVRFMNKTDGRITIDCAEEDKFWRFSVSDNGPGIEPQHFERIFRLFQTLDNHDEIENTGVGLALVKKIVELYGGRIWLISQPGQGTTFNFTLPKQTACADRPEAILQQH